MLLSFASGVERYSWHYFRALTSYDCIPDYHLLVFGNVTGLLTGGQFVKQLDLGGSDLGPSNSAIMGRRSSPTGRRPRRSIPARHTSKWEPARTW